MTGASPAIPRTRVPSTSSLRELPGSTVRARHADEHDQRIVADDAAARPRSEMSGFTKPIQPLRLSTPQAQSTAVDGPSTIDLGKHRLLPSTSVDARMSPKVCVPLRNERCDVMTGRNWKPACRSDVRRPPWRVGESSNRVVIWHQASGAWRPSDPDPFESIVGVDGSVWFWDSRLGAWLPASTAAASTGAGGDVEVRFIEPGP